MRPLSDTIGRLSALRSGRASPSDVPPGKLVPLHDFGSNPGALNAYFLVPQTVVPNPALVVVLHGCTQNAAGYDHGSGWSQVAEDNGFILLFPEQRRGNNMNLCFNWFEPGDNRKGAGEPLSICQMIDTMVARHGIDPARIFVNGLSAGGAMTSVMLATYPELFAGGAVIAGLPFGAAGNVPEALERMRGQGGPGRDALAAAVRTASPHKGPWPILSVWHGGADHVVVPANGDAILLQWQAIHDVGARPDKSDVVDGHPHRVWHDSSGRAVLEEFRITGMGHGTPLASRGEDGCGAAGPHMLEAGISSTRHIAHFWGLAQQRSGRLAEVPANRPGLVPARHSDAPRAQRRPSPQKPMASGVGKVIEDALRAAGLMR